MSFTNPLLVALSVTTGAGGFYWPISSRAVLNVDPCKQLTNDASSSASIALSITLLIVMHSTWMGPVSGGSSWGGFFGFVDGSLN